MPKKQKKTHRADGHYYLTADILRNKHACRSGTREFMDCSGAERADQQVPLTLELMKKISHYADWAADMMYHGKRITDEERDAFYDEYYDDTYSNYNEALAFMNLLERRAVREGRVRELAEDL
jgi:hypothetical protein